jgi:hypothetical protein
MKKYSKWVTPVRQAALVKMFELYGNKCLLGHSVCSNIEHYLIYRGKRVYVAIPQETEIVDRNGNPILENGKRKTVDGWKVVQEFLHSQEFTNLYELHSERLITDWKAEDSIQRTELWKREQRLLHKCPDEKGWGRVFDPVAKDQFSATREPFEIEAISLNPLTLQQVARIRVAGTGKRLFVNIMRHGKGKNARKKALRRAAQGIQPTNHRLMKAAVDRFWLSRV